jgi:alkylation response protein AidB-like acyl-CoA dehydrogenase
VLEPFNRQADRHGCALVEGRVKLAPGHHAAWNAFVEGGWTMTEGAHRHGGMGLPMAVHSACEELFNRASPAFGMLPTPLRCAARVIEKYGDPAMQAEWLPRLVAGEWGATICISEADADRTCRACAMAVPDAAGGWRITGEKMWITFGDHDLTARIGHMVLARTPDAPAGSAGLSLFLVPSVVEGARNAVQVRRWRRSWGCTVRPPARWGLKARRAR